LEVLVKRLLFGLFLGGLVALPAPTLASSVGYSTTAADSAATAAPGPADAARRGFSVRFTAITRNGRIRAVKRFRFNNVPMTCAQGATTVDGGPLRAMRVRNRTFCRKSKSHGGNVTTRVHGRFIRHGRRAKGFVKVTGDFAGAGLTDCNTGRAKWNVGRG
jgi:hypothetical protein